MVNIIRGKQADDATFILSFEEQIFSIVFLIIKII